MGTVLRLLVFLALAHTLARWIRHWSAEAKLEEANTLPDPHQILGINKNASNDDVRLAYRKKLSEYHPDKTQHLGVELQSLAKKKTEEIVQAYQLLNRKWNRT
jgi:preprotein translocase subunit Sec63